MSKLFKSFKIFLKKLFASLEMYFFSFLYDLCIFLFWLFVIFILFTSYHVCVFYSGGGIVKEILDNKIVSVVVLSIKNIGESLYFCLFYWLGGSRLGDFIACALLVIHMMNLEYFLFVVTVITYWDFFFYVLIESKFFILVPVVLYGIVQLIMFCHFYSEWKKNKGDKT